MQRIYAPHARSLAALLSLVLAGSARADLVNGNMETNGPAGWNPVNTVTAVDPLDPTNHVAFMTGTPLSPASILQGFDCDDTTPGATVCMISFRYRFNTPNLGNLKIRGDNLGWNREDGINAPNDSDWHDGSFLFNDGSCGQPLAIKFTAVEAVSIDDVTDSCVQAAPEPASVAALALGAVGLLRRRRKR